MGIEENPYEVGLGRLVELDNANDFIGRKVLERLKNEVVDKTLVGLFIDGSAIESNETPWQLFSDK